MRALIILAALFLLMVLIGWITINRGPDNTSINLETQKIESDTQQVRQSGEVLLEKLRTAVEK